MLNISGFRLSSTVLRAKKIITNEFYLLSATKFGRTAATVSLLVVIAGAVAPLIILGFVALLFLGAFVPASKKNVAERQQFFDKLGGARNLLGRPMIWVVPLFGCAFVLVAAFSLLGRSDIITVSSLGVFDVQFKLICLWSNAIIPKSICETEGRNLVSVVYYFAIQFFCLYELVLVFFFRGQARKGQYLRKNFSVEIGSLVIFTIVITIIPIAIEKLLINIVAIIYRNVVFYLDFYKLFILYFEVSILFCAVLLFINCFYSLLPSSFTRIWRRWHNHLSDGSKS